jgi:hypothetical protein
MFISPPLVVNPAPLIVILSPLRVNLSFSIVVAGAIIVFISVLFPVSVYGGFRVFVVIAGFRGIGFIGFIHI